MVKSRSDDLQFYIYKTCNTVCGNQTRILIPKSYFIKRTQKTFLLDPYFCVTTPNLFGGTLTPESFIKITVDEPIIKNSTKFSNVKSKTKSRDKLEHIFKIIKIFGLPIELHKSFELVKHEIGEPNKSWKI